MSISRRWSCCIPLNTQSDRELERFAESQAFYRSPWRQRELRPCVGSWVDVAHEIGRATFAFHVNAPDVFAEDANADQLHPAEEQDRHHQRRPTGNVDAKTKVIVSL